MIAPVLLAVLLLVTAFGRHANVQGAVDQAARDAARSATATRDADSAREAVDNTIEASLSTAPESCRDSAAHDVTTTHSNLFEASDGYDPALMNILTVTVSCNVDVSDLSFIGFGSTITLTAAFSSPVPALYGTY
jgi:Flp pilus assembly protein TadG